MRFSCLITKAADTHSEYVILIALPRQLCLLERASILLRTYRVIKKSLCTRNVRSSTDNTIITKHVFLASLLAQSDFLAADRQGQGDARLTLTPSVIPNSNCVIMLSDWNCLKYILRVFCTVIIRCTGTFWSPCTLPVSQLLNTA
jgi:hypothetical protein